MRVEHHIFEFDVAVEYTTGVKIMDCEDLYRLSREYIERVVVVKRSNERVERYKTSQTQDPHGMHSAPSIHAYHLRVSMSSITFDLDSKGDHQ